MRTVLEEQLFVNLPQEAMEDSDTFRNETLYTEACDTVLQVRVFVYGAGDRLQDRSSCYSEQTRPSQANQVLSTRQPYVP